MRKIILSVIALFLFTTLVYDQAFANSSANFGPPVVQGRKFICTDSKTNDVYRTSSWSCMNMRSAGSCEKGDVNIGLYSDGMQCSWRCARVRPICKWVDINA